MQIYVLEGTYQGRTEVIDQAETIADAEYMAREYRMAFGPAWTIIVRKAREGDDV